jgi:glycine cleavage system aminomethyltransferase T
MSAAPIRRTPMSRQHAALGAQFELEAGWEIPAAYEGDQTHLHTSVGLADLTPRAKIDVRGKVDGPLGVAGDGLVARIAPDWALVLDAPGAEEILLPKLEHAANAGAMVTDATHLFAGFGLAGPMLEEALSRLTSWDPAILSPGEATGAPIGGVRAVVVRRDLDVPLLEVYTATEFGRYTWETLLIVVELLGGGPVGWNALRAEGWR